MVNVPVRLVELLFALALYLTVPLPVPLAPDVTLIHDALLTAVQEHPDCEVTVSLRFTPAQPTELDRTDFE